MFVAAGPELEILARLMGVATGVPLIIDVTPLLLLFKEDKAPLEEAPPFEPEVAMVPE
jgi:hypothetical protein